jgi:CspA family cold shock protein
LAGKSRRKLLQWRDLTRRSQSAYDSTHIEDERCEATAWVAVYFLTPQFDGERMPTGKIKKVIAEKGFGFITGGKDDLFFHHSELKGVSIEELSEGQSVQYEIGQGKKGPCAVSVRLED